MKYLLFGTGEYYTRYKKWFAKEDVTALLDNAPDKQGTYIDGIAVVSPEEGIKLDYDAVMILSVYVKAMKRQLMELGVPKEKIYHYYDLNSLICRDDGKPTGWYKKPIRYYGKAAEAAGGILLLSHDLSLGGPALALYNMAKVLKARGNEVTFASTLDGSLREAIVEDGIPVIIDDNLQIETMNDAGWIDGYSVIVCNTLNFYVFLSERDLQVPIIWWLHDSAFFYDGVDRAVMKQIRFDNLKVASVGPVPEQAIREFFPDLDCEELLYGVADAADDAQKPDSSITRFITIGFLEDRKGQDVLIKAIRLLSDDVRQNCEFYIVGQDKSLFGDKIRQESRDIKEVIITGKVNREKIHELLAGSDWLVCPSRQDPMPTVAAEAMMHHIPCIVSDVTGTAAYICDGEDGFIFPSEDAELLASKIGWCVQNNEQASCMGNRARNIYEKYFSMQAFEKQLLQILNTVIKDVK
ncbi:MAG: glycosyltransferase family 4 protein [Butyrivibrio sp.]|nr:glycosyltransferase family 4 protein [Butyrivibrio sp.]